MALNGIDISSAQAGMDVTKVSAEFVIIKATQGTHYVNPFCDIHYQQAYTSKKLLGVYHYAEGGNPITEADYFLANVKGYIKGAILCLDWEDRDNVSFGVNDAAWVKAWCDRVYQVTGVKPLVYIQQSSMHKLDGIGDYGLWVAQYADDSYTGYQDHSWNEGAYSCAIRQYTSHGQLAGYAGRLDLDIAYMDAAAWSRYADPDGTHTAVSIPKTPEKPRKTNEELALEVMDGLWGNDPDRTKALTAAGYDAKSIQAIVDAKFYKKSNEELADEVIARKWGDDPYRTLKLTQAGYDAAAIQQIVNRKLGYDGGNTASQAVYYTVQQYDTLSEIAARYGTTFQHLAQINGIANPDLIKPGQVLKVSGSGTSASTNAPINVGDRVRVINAITYSGQSFKTWYDTYQVMELKGDRAVIGVNGQVTAAINVHNITKA